MFDDKGRNFGSFQIKNETETVRVRTEADLREQRVFCRVCSGRHGLDRPVYINDQSRRR